MEYAAADLAPRERYKVLASFVLPRPIAWVTSTDPTGVAMGDGVPDMEDHRRQRQPPADHG